MPFRGNIIGRPQDLCCFRAATPKERENSLLCSVIRSISTDLSNQLFIPSSPPQFISLLEAETAFSFYISTTMFRSAVVRSLRASVPRAVRTPASFQIRSSPIARPAQFAPRFAYQGVRLYSAPAGLNQEEVEGRIVNLLKNFDKVRFFFDRVPSAGSLGEIQRTSGNPLRNFGMAQWLTFVIRSRFPMLARFVERPFPPSIRLVYG